MRRPELSRLNRQVRALRTVPDEAGPNRWSDRYRAEVERRLASLLDGVRQHLDGGRRDEHDEIRRLRAEVHDWQALAIRSDEERAEAERRLRELERELAERNRRLEDLGDECDLAVLEVLESERDAYHAKRRLEALRRAVRSTGAIPEIIEHDAVEPLDPPTTCAEAVERARKLPHLRIPQGACRDIDRLDESADAALWAGRVYNHLRALDAYGEAKGPGFKIWCEAGGSPFAISGKFIAGDESQTVKANKVLRDARLFPVDHRVDPSGRCEMFSHIKCVQGGGLQIPRIYFHDDTKGETGLVHVGFIGPHDLVPNTRTN